MRSRRQQVEEEQEINLTPMLDVVFIMLIFFIVTATFVKQAGVEVKRPEAQTAYEQKRVGILIAITDEEEIWINNKEVDVRSVRFIVEKLRAENPQGTVVIQADLKSKSGVVIDVMDQLKETGVPLVSLAAERD